MSTIDRKALKESLLQAKRAAGNRPTLPALACARLTAEQGRLTVEATDLQMVYRDTLTTEGDAAWTAMAPVAHLDKIVSKLKGDTVTLAPNGDGTRLTITDGRADIEVRQGRAEDYPQLPVSGGGVETTVPTDLLAAAHSAVSTDEQRPTICAVYIDGPGGRVAGTDSYRMVVADLPESFEASTLVPGGPVKRILQAKPGDKLTVIVEDGQTVFRTTGGREWIVRNQEGTFPNIDGVWPDTFEHTATVDAARLAEACDRMDAVMSSKANAPLHLSVDGDRLSVLAKDRELGEVRESITCTGDMAEIALNPRMAKDILGLFDGDVSVLTRDGLKPFVIEDGGPVRALQMPMRVH